MGDAPMSARPPRLLWAAYLSGFVAGLDATSQFFVFPSIRDGLANGDAASASWILTVSGIVGAAILLQAGRLADRFGHDRVLVGGAVVFLVCTAIAAAAPTLLVLVLARAGQSAGLAGIGVSSIAIIVRDTPSGQLATALGTWGFWTSLSGVLGPVLTSTLVEVASWRLLFVAEIPFLVLLVVFALPGWSRPHTVVATARIDYVGMVLAVGGLAAVVLALLKGNAWGWGSAATLGSLVAGVAAVAVVVARSRGTEDGTIPLHVFSNRAYDLSFVTGLVANVAFFGMWLAGLQFMTQVWDFSVLQAGLLLTLMPATMSLLAVRGGADRRPDGLPRRHGRWLRCVLHRMERTRHRGDRGPEPVVDRPGADLIGYRHGHRVVAEQRGGDAHAGTAPRRQGYGAAADRATHRRRARQRSGGRSARGRRGR